MEFMRNSTGQTLLSQKYNHIVKDKGIEMEREIWRIKEVLVKGEVESESVLMHSLTALQRIEISHDVLKATMIGKPVSALRKHGSEQIRLLARALVLKWKRVVDVWIAEGVISTDNKEEQKLDVQENKKLDPTMKKSVTNESQQKPNRPLVQKISRATQEDNLNCRLEAIGKRLRENYQQAENAKRQRRIQVIDLHNLPNQARSQMKTHVEKKVVIKKTSSKCNRL